MLDDDIDKEMTISDQVFIKGSIPGLPKPFDILSSFKHIRSTNSPKSRLFSGGSKKQNDNSKELADAALLSRLESATQTKLQCKSELLSTKMTSNRCNTAHSSRTNTKLNPSSQTSRPPSSPYKHITCPEGTDSPQDHYFFNQSVFQKKNRPNQHFFAKNDEISLNVNDGKKIKVDKSMKQSKTLTDNKSLECQGKLFRVHSAKRKELSSSSTNGVVLMESSRDIENNQIGRKKSLGSKLKNKLGTMLKTPNFDKRASKTIDSSDDYRANYMPTAEKEEEGPLVSNKLNFSASKTQFKVLKPTSASKSSKNRSVISARQALKGLPIDPVYQRFIDDINSREYNTAQIKLDSDGLRARDNHQQKYIAKVFDVLFPNNAINRMKLVKPFVYPCSARESEPINRLVKNIPDGEPLGTSNCADFWTDKMRHACLKQSGMIRVKKHLDQVATSNEAVMQFLNENLDHYLQLENDQLSREANKAIVTSQQNGSAST